MKYIKLIVLVSVAMFSSVALGQSSARTAQADFNPVTTVTPFEPSDTYTVLAFFKYSCPVCRNMSPILENWGHSLPKKFKFQFSPVLEQTQTGEISGETLNASLSYWSVYRSVNQESVSMFHERAYELSQDNREDASPKAWALAVASTGISRQQYLSALNEENSLLLTRYKRQLHYMPAVTPSLVICGKWMISPDSANGDPELFIQLANGLVSKCMQENGVRP